MCKMFQGSAKRLVHILFVKCPVFRTFTNRLSEFAFLTATCFLDTDEKHLDPLAHRLCEDIFERSPSFYILRLRADYLWVLHETVLVVQSFPLFVNGFASIMTIITVRVLIKDFIVTRMIERQS